MNRIIATTLVVSCCGCLFAGAQDTSQSAGNLTLLSGWTHFPKTQADQTTSQSNIGTQQLTLTMGDATWVNDTSFTTDVANNSSKTSIDLSSLNLQASSGDDSTNNGYTVNVNLQVSTKQNMGALLSLDFDESGSSAFNNIIVRTTKTDQINIADNGSKISGSGTTTADVTGLGSGAAFSLTVAIHSNGGYTVFVSHGDDLSQVVSMTPSDKTHTDKLQTLYLGAWPGLDTYHDSIEVTGISIWSGMATQADLSRIIHVPEPAAGALCVLGVLGCVTRRKRRA